MKVSPSAPVSETGIDKPTLESSEDKSEEPKVRVTETGTPVDDFWEVPEAWKESSLSVELGKLESNSNKSLVSRYLVNNNDPKGPVSQTKLLQLGIKDLSPSDIYQCDVTCTYWARRYTPTQYRARGDRKKRYGVEALPPSDKLIPFIVIDEKDTWESYIQDFLRWDAQTKSSLTKMAKSQIKPATVHSKWTSFAEERLKGNPKAFMSSKGFTFASIGRT